MSDDSPHFADHFSAHATDYSRYRPRYPQALFDWLAEQAEASGPPALAWDCATGNGQAALALADRFDRVVATDASADQIAAATAHPSVRYEVRDAGASGLPDQSAALVTVAQALHWFDRPAFYAEAARVLRPGGVVAAWCYELFEVNPAFDAVVQGLYEDIVGDDWPPERRHIEAGYATVGWPWPTLPAPALQMTMRWTLDQTLGYLRTWSAVRRHQAREQTDPVTPLERRLRDAWGPQAPRKVSWPLQLLASTPT